MRNIFLNCANIQTIEEAVCGLSKILLERYSGELKVRVSFLVKKR